jgi:N-acetyl-gamma-glutamyl-phosphate reductase
MGSTERLPVAIIGASGYGGVQLARLLVEHPLVEIAYMGGSGSAGSGFGDLYPHLAHSINITIENAEPTGDRRSRQDCIFVIAQWTGLQNCAPIAG